MKKGATSTENIKLLAVAALLLAGCGQPGEAVVDIGREACKPHGGLNSAENMLRLWDVQFQCKNGVLIFWKPAR
jgi:hypothetical protein